MAKNTSAADSTSAAAVQRRIRAADKQAAKIVADAEELVRGLVLDARATAEGVRAEGMELVSRLRQTGDALRASAELLEADLDSIHAWMVRELERVSPGGKPDGATDRSPVEATVSDEKLDVPDFVARR